MATERHYNVELSDRAKKSLKKLPKDSQKRILEKTKTLSIHPLTGEKLEGELSSLRRLRVWPYRVIYRISNSKNLVEIVDIGHRQGIYK